MFAHQVDELLRLASGDEAWTRGPSASAAEQRAVRDTVNSRIASPAEKRCTTVSSGARKRPDAPAVLSSSGDLTYAQLRDQVLAFAAALRDNGIRTAKRSRW